MKCLKPTKKNFKSVDIASTCHPHVGQETPLLTRRDSTLGALGLVKTVQRSSFQPISPSRKATRAGGVRNSHAAAICKGLATNLGPQHIFRCGNQKKLQFLFSKTTYP